LLVFYPERVVMPLSVRTRFPWKSERPEMLHSNNTFGVENQNQAFPG
jgi:hypothetical protein